MKQVIYKASGLRMASDSNGRLDKDLEILRSRGQASEILKTNEFRGEILYKLSTNCDGKMDIFKFSKSP